MGRYLVNLVSRVEDLEVEVEMVGESVDDVVDEFVQSREEYFDIGSVVEVNEYGYKLI